MKFSIGDLVMPRMALNDDFKRNDMLFVIGASQGYIVVAKDKSAPSTHRYEGPEEWFEPYMPEEQAIAVKYDSGKPKLSLIPKAALDAEARVFDFGANKYGRDNYRSGMNYTRLVDASLRHITAYQSGEDLDPESGLPHLAHARCCLAMLLYYTSVNKGTDDRYKEDSKSFETGKSQDNQDPK